MFLVSVVSRQFLSTVVIKAVNVISLGSFAFMNLLEAVGCRLVGHDIGEIGKEARHMLQGTLIDLITGDLKRVGRLSWLVGVSLSWYPSATHFQSECEKILVGRHPWFREPSCTSIDVQTAYTNRPVRFYSLLFWLWQEFRTSVGVSWLSLHAEHVFHLQFPQSIHYHLLHHLFL